MALPPVILTDPLQRGTLSAPTTHLEADGPYGSGKNNFSDAMDGQKKSY